MHIKNDAYLKPMTTARETDNSNISKPYLIDWLDNLTRHSGYWLPFVAVAKSKKKKKNMNGCGC
jgi:hypothetical protein